VVNTFSTHYRPVILFYNVRNKFSGNKVEGNKTCQQCVMKEFAAEQFE